MSTNFKLLTALIAVIAIAGMVFINNNQRDYEAQITHVQGLSQLQDQGRVEVRGFNGWCQSNKRPQESVTQCIERFRAQVEREKCALSKDKTPAELNRCADEAVCRNIRKVKPDQIEACIRRLSAQRVIVTSDDAVAQPDHSPEVKEDSK